MQTMLYTGASVRLAIAYESGEAVERTIGYASGLNFSQSLGAQNIMGVDSVFPQEIALAAGQSMVQGSMNIFMLKGTDPIRMGLVAPAVDSQSTNNNYPQQAPSRYCHFRFYDRQTGELLLSIEFCKVTSWQVAFQARQTLQASVSFTGMWVSYGG